MIIKKIFKYIINNFLKLFNLRLNRITLSNNFYYHIVKTLDFGHYHALVIGNNDYQVLPNLNTAINDAKYMAKILQEDYGFIVKTIENATEADIMGAIYELRKKLKANDNLLIFSMNFNL